MIFEKDHISFHILDVLELNQKNVNQYDSGRNFSAISYRFHANTTLKTETKEYPISDHCVTYVPARLNYTRHSHYDRLIVVHFDTLNYHSNEIECFMAENRERFADLFLQILEVWNKKETGYIHKCSALLYDIFFECYRQNYRPKNTTSKIHNSMTYLQQHYTDPTLTIGMIAAQSYISEVYFRKLFKREFDVSPQKYISSLRIQHATGLISTGYYSLKEVASLSGFSDYKYFSVEFKRQIGISPSKYFYNYNK